MKAYHTYILEALREHQDRAFAVDVTTGEYLDSEALRELEARAVKYAYEASCTGSWDGLGKILHTRYAISGGDWYLVRTISPRSEAPLPRIALYTPTTREEALPHL